MLDLWELQWGHRRGEDYSHTIPSLLKSKDKDILDWTYTTYKEKVISSASSLFSSSSEEWVLYCLDKEICMDVVVEKCQPQLLSLAKKKERYWKMVEGVLG